MGNYQDVTLQDKYKQKEGIVFITGIQALVRLPMDQYRLDQRAGLHTAGFISGYRGSPLGGLDQQVYQASDFLDKCHIVFKEGLNEDLAATAVWGSQMTPLFPGAKYQGVFGLWYGKAPGVDRSGDVFKHANFAGTSPYGGVIAIAGDDPTCKSSTLPSQSEYALMDAEMPILCPSNIQEVLDYGLYGWALSRYSGVWVGIIALADNMDSGAVCNIDSFRLTIRTPENFNLPQGGLHIRRQDLPLNKETRLRHYKLPAVQAFVRENKLNKIVLKSANPRVGIVTMGQANSDVFEALECLGISREEASDLGLSIYKIAMPWPLEREGLEAFAEGLETLLVVEHKRPFLEQQVRSVLYDMKSGRAPQILGKLGRNPILRDSYISSIPDLMEVLLDFLPEGAHTERSRNAFDFIKQATAKKSQEIDTRTPYFCSGCPHDISTQLPENTRALAGIGCHYMASFHDKNTDMTSHMGAEGVSWIGQSPFTEEEHVFVNLGDGTYSHSGSLAIRASIAAGTNITYKLLYNDAVAMTGGQTPDMKARSVPYIVQQLRAEGVEHIAIVTDSIKKYHNSHIIIETPVYHRRELLKVQKSFARTKGVSVILYDQMCATEKRRKRKRNLLPQAAARPFINTDVCENCGDCSAASRCISVETVDTPLGLKKQINQSSCNQDMSCVDGFCPSFVSVMGGEMVSDQKILSDLLKIHIPMPRIKKPDGVYNILFSGIGGAGVTMVAAIIGMAGHLDGLNITTLDMTGLAQKGGAVFSHVRLAEKKFVLSGNRISPASADVLISADLIVSMAEDICKLLSTQRTKAVLNQNIVANSDVIFDRNKTFATEAYLGTLGNFVKESFSFEAHNASEQTLGNAIYTNMILLGYAWQKGWIPISYKAIEAALILNQVKVGMNKKAFELGRLWADQPEYVKASLFRQEPPIRKPKSLEEIIQHRETLLKEYQDRNYADRYRKLVDLVLEKEQETGIKGHQLAKAVAINYAKLMAYKDEYEVARLYLKTAFFKNLKNTFSGNFKLKIHLAPPLLTKQTDENGRPIKKTYGKWIFIVFRVLLSLKRVRGTLFDPFGWTKERKMERQLIKDYETDIRVLLKDLKSENYVLAVKISELPDQIRGYGYIKHKSVEKVKKISRKLWNSWNA